ncbi:sialate:O-sulfotransferase 1-like [Ptychodera flava]|uniref:sialate:O-sulfotransferase 1-like n=1 Tax=Ptychodera flava TaxID=63121 RepID=UPI003969CDA7
MICPRCEISRTQLLRSLGCPRYVPDGSSSEPTRCRKYVDPSLDTTSDRFLHGSQYRYQVLADTGYGGEMENITSGTTLTFKTHWVDFDRPGLTGVERQVRAVILLLRNPCNLAISERNRRETINQTGMVAWNSSLRNDREWFSVLEWQVHLYERFVNNWIGIGKPILVVHYENIKEDAVRELRRVVKFLNLTVDNERLECVRGNIEGNYHRKYSDKSQLYRDVLRRLSNVTHRWSWKEFLTSWSNMDKIQYPGRIYLLVFYQIPERRFDIKSLRQFHVLWSFHYPGFKVFLQENGES